jgi:hypothetical protein
VDALVLGPPHISRRVAAGDLTVRPASHFTAALPSGLSTMLQKPFDVVYYTIVPYL